MYGEKRISFLVIRRRDSYIYIVIFVDQAGNLSAKRRDERQKKIRGTRKKKFLEAMQRKGASLNCIWSRRKHNCGLDQTLRKMTASIKDVKTMYYVKTTSKTKWLKARKNRHWKRRENESEDPKVGLRTEDGIIDRGRT